MNSQETNIKEINSEMINIEELKNENLEIVWKFVINSKYVESKYDEELVSVTKKISMPGFRNGKVPMHLVKSRYSETIYEDVSRKLLEQVIADFIKGKEQIIKFASAPNLEDLHNINGKDIEFLLKVEYLPEITMPDFKVIKIEKSIVEVKEKDIEDELKEIIAKNKNYVTKQGKAVNGDAVNIMFNGKINGEEFPGGHSEKFFLELGSKSMIPGFEEQIIGHEAEEEFTIKVSFPDDYHAKHLASKEAEFDIKIHEVSEVSSSEINDEFVQKTFKLKNLAELKENIKKSIENNYEEQIDLIVKMKLFDELENLLAFEVPKILFQNEYHSVKHQTENDKEFRETLKSKSEEDLEKYYKKIANRRVKIALLIAEYAKINNIEISNEELRLAITKRAMSMPGYEKMVIDFYSKNPKAVQEITGSILEEKVVKTIIEKEVSLDIKTISKDKLDKLIDQENNKEIII
jgi:trigger factor